MSNWNEDFLIASHNLEDMLCSKTIREFWETVSSCSRLMIQKSLSVSFNWPGGVLHFVVTDGCGQCCPLPLHPQFGPNICVSQQFS